MDASGAMNIELLVFQLFFMAAGLAGGIRIVDDLKRWIDGKQGSSDV